MTETETKTKAKPTDREAEPLTPDEQKRRFAKLCEQLGTDQGDALDMALGKIV